MFGQSSRLQFPWCPDRRLQALPPATIHQDPALEVSPSTACKKQACLCRGSSPLQVDTPDMLWNFSISIYLYSFTPHNIRWRIIDVSTAVLLVNFSFLVSLRHCDSRHQQLNGCSGQDQYRREHPHHQGHQRYKHLFSQLLKTLRVLTTIIT